MEVLVSRKMITHYQAMCFECDFCEADHVDRERVRRAVYAHVKATGHKVSIEKGISAHYQAVEQSVQRTCAKCGNAGKPITDIGGNQTCPECGASR